MVKRGEIYKTVGGWDALVVYVPFIKYMGFYAVHKPDTEEDSVPIYHLEDGKAGTAFSVNERPCYGKHPADIILGGKDG